MNKFKLKVLLIITLLFNFFIGVKNAFAAIRKSYISTKSSKSYRHLSPTPSTSSSSLSKPSTSSKARLTYSRLPSSSSSRVQKQVVLTISEDKVRLVLSDAKSLVKEKNYTIVPKLNDSLKFMNYSKREFRRAFNSLTYEDYVRTQISKTSNQDNIYIFEKNEDNGKNIYFKFSLDKKSKNLNIIGYNNSDVKFEGISPEPPDISTILGNESLRKLNLIGRSADKALHIVKEKILKNKYYLPYRVRNELREAGYNYKTFVKILLSLKKTDYILGPENPHENTGKMDINKTVWVFGFNDKVKKENLYIKFIIDENEDTISFLSFHPTDRPLRFFFK